MMTQSLQVEIHTQRIDKWLWHARIVRTRTLAARLSVGGKVRIDKRRVTRASQQIRCGNIITVPQGERILVLRVLGFAARRVSAALVSSLYEDLSPPSQAIVGQRRSDAGGKLQQGREAGSGRPTKKDRRRFDRLTRTD